MGEVYVKRIFVLALLIVSAVIALGWFASNILKPLEMTGDNITQKKDAATEKSFDSSLLSQQKNVYISSKFGFRFEYPSDFIVLDKDNIGRIEDGKSTSSKSKQELLSLYNHLDEYFPYDYVVAVLNKRNTDVYFIISSCQEKNQRDCIEIREKNYIGYIGGATQEKDIVIGKDKIPGIEFSSTFEGNVNETDMSRKTLISVFGNRKDNFLIQLDYLTHKHPDLNIYYIDSYYLVRDSFSFLEAV
jgi:hypothetical protein